MTKQTTVTAEARTQGHDYEANHCRNLIFEILNRAINDVAIERRRKDALGFFCSSYFETLAHLLGLDVEIVRSKMVPADFRLDYQRRIAQRVFAPGPTMPVPASTWPQGATETGPVAEDSIEDEFAALVEKHTLLEVEGNFYEYGC